MSKIIEKMTDKQIIEKFILDEHLDQAIEALDHNIEKDPENAEWWYLRGQTYWRMQKRSNAISDLEEAIHLDPNSPAKLVLEMINGIMDFYNTDLFNP